MNASSSNPLYTDAQLTLLRDLFAAGCVLIGDEVERRVGLRSPIYINMRESLYDQPELLWRVGGEFAWKIVELATAKATASANVAAADSATHSLSNSADNQKSKKLTSLPANSLSGSPAPQTVVGIPDTATPLAMTTALFSWGNRTNPRITFAMLRKEAKRYPGHEPSYWLGPAAQSNGADDGREYNLIDDVVASGLTKRAAAAKMRAEGIPLTRIIVFFDRGQGDGLREEGYQLHGIFNLRAVADFYAEEKLITPADHHRIVDFVSTRRFDRQQA